MSAASGIDISPELSEAFASAVSGTTVRFLKISIENESLVPNGSVDAESATMEEDLLKLQDLLENDVPAYVLARLDGQNAGWLAITYVPDTANVRRKMLYASTRASLTKSLGSANFTDALFATSKGDLTAESYATHKAHTNAPQPLSARERQIADERAADRRSAGTYEGSSARRNHVGKAVGLKWSDEAEDAVKALGEGKDDTLVLLAIDPTTETLTLSSTAKCAVDKIAASLPKSEPSYAFFAWSHEHGSSPRRDVVFIYTCPSSSPIKNRMMFASGAAAVNFTAKALLKETSASYADRKIETSELSELTEKYLLSQLGLDKTIEKDTDGGAVGKVGGEGRAFARPKGPGRKR
ncbi:hypothetical protein EW145_g4563 [Phellinidium pouzarii]|uniref:ADF-H domain-containing protein n=1 Tax=Phellinidium pouzarii TaxID=167371 RepID=A0A4S4L7Y1_9AGAM|nr:hypothetical protein EW145_g4563 [Phellinidium pouzarii]